MLWSKVNKRLAKKKKNSFKHQNKRFSITQNESKEQIISFLKKFGQLDIGFLKKYGVESVMEGADQMPLHWNKIPWHRH